MGFKKKKKKRNYSFDILYRHKQYSKNSTLNIFSYLATVAALLMDKSLRELIIPTNLSWVRQQELDHGRKRAACD